MKFVSLLTSLRPRTRGFGKLPSIIACLMFASSWVSAQEPLRDPNVIVDGLSKAVEENPENPKTRLMRGLYYLWTLFDFEKALADFEKVIEMDPECAEAYIGRADVYTGSDARLYDPAKAVKDIEKVFEIAPNLADAYRIRGDMPSHKGFGEAEEALRDYSKAIELDPTNMLAHLGLASTYAKQDTDFQDMQKSLDFARKAVEVAPTESLAYEVLGDLLASEEESRAEALQFMNRAITLNPLNGGAYLGRGYLYQTMAIPEEFSTLLAAVGESTTPLDSIRGRTEVLDKALEQLGRRSFIARALSDFEKAQELSPYNEGAYLAQATLLSPFAGQERRVLKLYDKTLALEPRRAIYYLTRAEFLYANPHLALSPAEVEGAEKLEVPELIELITGLIKKRFPELAPTMIQDCTKALELDPEYDKAYALRGSVHAMILNNYDAGIEDLSHAIRIAPNAVTYYQARADIHEAFGRSEQAEADREVVLRLESFD